MMLAPQRAGVVERRQRADRAQVGEQPEPLAQAEQALLGPRLVGVGRVPLRAADRGEQDAVGRACTPRASRRSARVPCASMDAPPTRCSSVSTSGATASRTRSAAARTSGPMPSPGRVTILGMRRPAYGGGLQYRRYSDTVGIAMATTDDTGGEQGGDAGRAARRGAAGVRRARLPRRVARPRRRRGRLHARARSTRRSGRRARCSSRSTSASRAAAIARRSRDAAPTRRRARAQWFERRARRARLDARAARVPPARRARPASSTRVRRAPPRVPRRRVARDQLGDGRGSTVIALGNGFALEQLAAARRRRSSALFVEASTGAGVP